MLRRILVASSLAVSLTACGGGSNQLPDAGVLPLGCTPDELETHLGIRVVDENGDPVADAEITARNLGTGKTVTATTGGDGRTSSVGTSLGSGSVQVFAKKGTRMSESKQAEFNCGECTCNIEPSSVTLTLPN